MPLEHVETRVRMTGTTASGRVERHAASAFLASAEYEERVYAGVLGKMIGVYLGRPFEGWSNEKIEAKLGEVDYYVNDRLGWPLVVTDDDLSGTFCFVRALAENGYPADLSAKQIGDWWLNTTIQNRTTFWWGGFGTSTENTAYLRLKSGIPAPRSGSIACNGKTVAEQIGAQIFIDGWAMVSPGDPERAARLAKAAGSVSHDGEAVYAAQVIAAMEAMAFVSADTDRIIDTAVELIPRDSVIFRMIADIREWARTNKDDWRKTMRSIQETYGYDKFGGGCHVVPNHALVMLAVLHGNDDFRRALTIVNTAGWDTDCNSGNVGCFLGIKNGLGSFDHGPDWRGPVADRLFVITADGARATSDAVRETYSLVDTARALNGLPTSSKKRGARFHFSLPGSTQGFRPSVATEGGGAPTLSNEDRMLTLTFDTLTAGRVATDTFIPPDALKMAGYNLVASPSLYSGQRVIAVAVAGALSTDVSLSLFVGVYGPDDDLVIIRGDARRVTSKQQVQLEFEVPDTGGQPIAEVGLDISSNGEPASGSLYLDSLTWTGSPNVQLRKPDAGSVWLRAWVNGATHFDAYTRTPGMTYRMVQDEGLGIVSQGEWTWSDYRVSATLVPHLVQRTGLIACLRGLRRYVAIELEQGGSVRLVAQRDDVRLVLAEFRHRWEMDLPLDLALSVFEGRITASAGSESHAISVEEGEARGAVGMLLEAGTAEFGDVTVTPL